MKIIALQDNLSKVKAVEELYQQMLRFPDDVQQAVAGQLQKQRNLRRRQVNRSKRSDESTLRARKESPDLLESEARGRRQEPASCAEEETGHQCCIDFRV